MPPADGRPVVDGASFRGADRLLVRVHYPDEFRTRRPQFLEFFTILVDILERRGHRVQFHPDADACLARHGGERGIIFHGSGRSPGMRYVKPSYIAQRFYFERGGYSGSSELALDPHAADPAWLIEPEEAATFVAAMRRNYFDRGRTRQPQSREAFPADDRPRVFLALQVAHDRVLEHSRVEDYPALPGLVADALAGTGIELVVKRHPACRSPVIFRALADVSRRPMVRISGASIGSLFAAAGLVLTVNSGVGFEALFHGKSVATLGHSDYARVTHRLASTADLISLPDLLDRPAAPGRAAQLITFMTRDWFVGTDDAAAIEARVAMLEGEAPDG